MLALENKPVAVVGLSERGQAAARLLRRRGALVQALEPADTAPLRRTARELRAVGIRVKLGAVRRPPDATFEWVVLSPEVERQSGLVRSLQPRVGTVLSELELGYRLSQALHVAVSGTNGKSTTLGLIERILTQAQRRVAIAGSAARPFCALVEQTRQLDFVLLEAEAAQLEGCHYLRPIVAVLLNLAPGPAHRFPAPMEYVQATARLFVNQQPFDWAVVQSEALAQIRLLGLPVPAKTITFSAVNRRADLYLDRSLLVSRLPDWTGPLLDLDRCRLRGPHNAENVMAALLVGRILRVPLERMVEAVQGFEVPADCCEPVGEVRGVRFINDAKAENLEATQKALESVPLGAGGEPAVWLIAGGRDQGLEYHDLGPLLAQRVKGAVLYGECREKLRAAWSLFTPCTLVGSLLEAVSVAAQNALSGDTVLLSPACSSFDMFPTYQQRGEVFRQAVAGWANATGGACGSVPPSAGGGGPAPPEAPAGRPQGLGGPDPVALRAPTMLRMNLIQP
ncbi:MAG: UDP-N-acetylmuramoyl-L-alanine--D-glutamate ligase [Verrucomicrobia bacterium]|nr:UDP-N-acetylmuramoyl-L-alanine--D-glutamate ligase [Verrucomicrobiota bacterium]